MAPNSMAGASPTPTQGAAQSTSQNGHSAMPSPFSPAGPDMGIDAVLKPLIDGSFAIGNSMPAASAAPAGQAAQQGVTPTGKPSTAPLPAPGPAPLPIPGTAPLHGTFGPTVHV